MKSFSEGGNSLRIMFDAVTLRDPPTGVAIYAAELATALARRPDIELTVAFPTPGPPGSQHLRPSRSHRQLWRQFKIPRALSSGNFDVYHCAEYGSLIKSPTPRVATVHDLFFKNLRKMFDLRGRWFLRTMVHSALLAERIIVPSAHVAEQLVTEFGYPRPQVRVVHEAPQAFLSPAGEDAIKEVRHALGVDRPYVLCVGIGHRGKRAVDVLRALAMLRGRGIDIQAVMVGWPDPRVGSALKKEAGRLEIEESVYFTEYFRGDLAALYSGALAFVCASIEEGFGIPPLEAMACGVPVISTTAPAMNETLAGAALFVPVRNPQAIADAVRQLFESRPMRDEYRARGLEHSSKFTWARAADQTVDVYRELA